MTKKLFILVILVFVFVPVFAQTVDTAWVRRYNGPGNGEDKVSDLVIDRFGNIYVTGTSYGGDETYYDYATIKYYPNGDAAWVRRYNTPAFYSLDEARAIAVDSLGNVYVTGTGGTIKYDSYGNQLWIGSYGGIAIAVDDYSNIYVTGASWNTSTNYDYTTIKYHPNGDTVWVRRYNGAGNEADMASAITVDYSYNVYVTGKSYDNRAIDYDYATVKYCPNGDTAWVRRYNATESSEDCASAIIADDSGNVYVTGWSVQIYGYPNNYDYTTIKYYPNGDTAWVRVYNGTGNWTDEAKAIALDSNGNVYVTGLSIGIEISYDYATIKYYPDGDTTWVRRYDGPIIGGDYATDIAVDSSGNVFVTGSSEITALYNDDYVTIKYYPDGDTAWIVRYNGPENLQDVATDLAIDNSGNIYVAGSSAQSGYPNYNFDYVTIKYVQTPVKVKDESEGSGKPSEFALSQNYPNPFNLNTKIEFTLPNSGFVSLNIYDLLGRKVRALVSENLSPGYKSVLWDGKDNSGKEVASGIYFYQLKMGDFSQAKKLVLLK